jgi:hypothetical protein
MGRYTTKPSAEETFERRLEVFRLQLRGIRPTEISRELGVSMKTIRKDRKWLENHLREVALNADRFKEIGEAMAVLGEVEQEALYHMAETENAHAKNNYLQTAMKARVDRTKLMMDSGIIPKATEEVNVHVGEMAKMSVEELVQRRQRVVAELQDLEGRDSGASRN